MKKYRLAAALCAAFVLCLSFSTVAYAGGGEETEEPAPTESAVEETNPFTPAGTGTVIDNATDGDGKEFYTIMTPDENVFYLIIDRQRETENVYFLNAVTERDLLALAEKSEDTGENVSAIPDNTTPAVTEPTPDPEPTPEPEPEKSGSNGGIIIVVLIALAAGGAGYYFKIYKPKQQADTGADYEAEEDYGDYEDTYGDDAEDDDPPWEDDDEGAEEDE